MKTPRPASPRTLIAMMLVVLVAITSNARRTSAEISLVRAMWVWNTSALYDETERTQFVGAATTAAITDVYLYLEANDYVAAEANLRDLLGILYKSGFRAWGLEGWRGYFGDVEGPGALYAAAEALIAFNMRNPTVAFFGFHSDLEPQDGQGVGRPRFHNGLPQSRLSTEQLVARDSLMSEWLEMHVSIHDRMKAAGLQYGGALPSWVDDYYGEPVQAIFRGQRKALLEHLLSVIPQYVVMSYNTDPTKLIERVEGEMAHAAASGGKARVMFAVETHSGVGSKVSYADTPSKNSKAFVMRDLATIDAELTTRFPKSYLGWAIHDWKGWRDLPD